MHAITSKVVMWESISAAARKTLSEMVDARVSTAAKPMAGKTYALLAWHRVEMHPSAQLRPIGM